MRRIIEHTTDEKRRNFFRKLGLVRDHELEKGVSTVESRKALLDLQDRLVLDSQAIRLAVWMNYCDDESFDINPDTLSTILELPVEVLSRSMDKLYNLGVVILLDYGYKISGSGMDVLFDIYDAPLKEEATERYIYDIVKDLKSKALGHPSSSHAYVDELWRVFRRTGNLVFTKGFMEICPDRHDTGLAVALMIFAVDFINYGLQPRSLPSQCSHQEFEDGVSRLESDGWVMMLLTKGAPSFDDDEDDNEIPKYLLSPKACGKLFFGQDEIVKKIPFSEYGEFIRWNSIVEKNLFFNPEEADTPQMLRKIASQEFYSQIMERMHNRGRRGCISCLLYGDPGTGKTELVKQMALESKRDIMIVDSAKLNSKYVGDSEKIVRTLFENMRYFQQMSRQSPVLLFNEADSIIGKRLDVVNSNAFYINTVQNILLQEFEEYEGILVATTNFAGNIDSAFDRRFLYKARLSKPSVETRCRLWRSMIPDLSAEEAKVLATYDISGGHIDNVAKKRDIYEILHGESPSLEQMEQYCQQECALEKKAKRHTIKGFTSYV